MGFSVTAPEFVPGSQEYVMEQSELPHFQVQEPVVASFVYYDPQFMASLADEPRLSVLNPLTGDFINVSPLPCPFDFEANEDFDAEYAFDISRGAFFSQEQHEAGLYPHGFHFRTIDNRDDTVPEPFCAIRCPERYPLSTPRRPETSALWTQNNRQSHLIEWYERWTQYEEYTIEEMEGSCIHHFSFFNHRVYSKSATKPATTIAVLKSSSKHLAMTDARDLRIPITVSWASRFLDPVRYTGDPEILDAMRGTELENAVMGHCDKLYTGNGWWLYDQWSQEDDLPLLDPLATDKYQRGHTIINGCAEGFPTSRAILSAGTEEKLAIDKARKAALQSRIARGPVKSRLELSCVSSSDLEEVIVFPSVNAQHSQHEKQPACDAGQDIETPTAAAIVAPVPLSREEFHRRLAAFPLGSGDWDEEEDEPAPMVEAASSEREAWLRRLEELGPLGSSNWADDIEDEEAELASSTETAETKAPSLPEPSTTAQDEPSCPSEASRPDREAWIRRLEALGPLGSANWADDIDDVEEGEEDEPLSPASSVALESVSSETRSPSTSFSAFDTSSSATSVASLESAETKSQDSHEADPASNEEDEVEIVGTIVDLDSDNTFIRPSINEETVPAPAAGPEAISEAMPLSPAQPEILYQAPPVSALASLRRHMAEAATYSAGWGSGYDQWPDFSGAAGFEALAPTSAHSVPASFPIQSGNNTATPKGKSRQWLKRGLVKVMGLLTGKASPLRCRTAIAP
ncbi:hypothetical protein A1O3_05341 [Capronia epimyces CBS 606.96]|uniref:Uncharacterized protein n=1 Tax=Capronia epimyces CBS 606.96 TaxID=1182542 RepID=W9Y615_9EURO|nr:uncharacterized protein A1O3_05341 [Capronia epimyces CBS 606.96]EXJ84671.1 hypothetical protein A1O3_05341 [Capronia epimyces CBS 606.96]